MNDDLLEPLAYNGIDSYVYNDDQDEAQKIFVEGPESTLQIIALDVKIQVFAANL